MAESGGGGIFERSRRLLGNTAMEILAEKRVLIFGIGGVGSYVAEALCRSGVGALGLVDMDTVALTNLNRQLIATAETLGELKVEAAKKRLLSINPECNLELFPIKYEESTQNMVNLSRWNYIIDAIDMVASKVLLVKNAYNLGVPIISSMGTGNKLDPSRLRVSTLNKTHTCPLARVMRRELKAFGISRLKVVWSDENPLEPETSEEKGPGSVAWVPGAAGLMIAGHVVCELAGRGEEAVSDGGA